MMKLAIIGGGASGLVAACVAAELSHAFARNAGKKILLEITLFEATDKIGRPILKSGNGRCNLTNAHPDESLYHNSDFVAQVFERASGLRAPLHLDKLDFQYPQNIVASYFEQHGVVLREESEGRIYPLANKASSVLDALKRVIMRFNVNVRLGVQIASIDEPKSDKAPITLRTDSGEFIRADHVIDATGGTQSKGVLCPFIEHTEKIPTLGSIATDNKLIKRLDNIRVRGEVSLISKAGNLKAKERGEVMFRKYGISGIAVFNLSRFLEPGDKVSLDLIPGVARDDMAQYLSARSAHLASCMLEQPTRFEMLAGIVLPDVADVLLKYVSLDGDVTYSSSDAPKIIDALKSFALESKGMGDASLCQVARGGYLVGEIDPDTLSSRSFPRIHITGENLDVDGPCGGYNLHWAFVTGMLSAYSAFTQATKASC